MYVDYIMYITKLKKKESVIILFDFFIFLATVNTFIKEIIESTSFTELSFSIITLVVLTTIKFMWDCYKMYTDYGSYKQEGVYSTKRTTHIVDEKGIFEISEIKPSESENVNKFSVQPISARSEHVLQSAKLDSCIRGKEYTLKISSGKKDQINKLIKERADTLLPFLTHQFRHSKNTNKLFFNQRKLCLAEDINLQDDIVYCHQGTYYDTFLTNIISLQKLVETQNPDHVIFDGRRMYPYEIIDKELRLLNVTSSKVNNEIGVSTLAFTEDQYLVIWKQNERAQSSSTLLVPSGSGSCDWSDIIEGSFTKTIKKGMNRELWEESSLRNFKLEQIGDTRVIGFFRWIEKAGKPEFVGITKMKVRYNDINANKSEVYSTGTGLVQVKTLVQLKNRLVEIKQQTNISVPLFMNIVSLEEYIESEPQEVISFLGLTS
jgi:hypothetical protein